MEIRKANLGSNPALSVLRCATNGTAVFSRFLTGLPVLLSQYQFLGMAKMVFSQTEYTTRLFRLSMNCQSVEQVCQYYDWDDETKQPFFTS